MLFKRFRENYCNLTFDDTKNYNFLSYDNEEKSRINEVIAKVSECLQSKLLSFRDDYKELLELTYVLLTRDITNFKIKTPGALHKARWMAKLLYSFKIILLSNKIETELPRGAVYSSGVLKKITKFVKIVLLQYVSWWIDSTSSINAPINDFNLLCAIRNYPEQSIKNCLLKTMSNHL